MIRALGKTVTLNPGQPLTKHDFYLPLSDVLLDLVEQDLHGPSAKSASQLGCSLAHDFIRLSTVAGQLLWLVEVAPLRTGTPDLLSITMLAESYLMSLRSACDVIAVIIHTFCIDDKKKGQVPDESFNGLIDWIESNPKRVPESIKFVAEHRDWFADLRSIRDKLVHHRFDINIFMNGVFPSFSLMSTGDLHLHFLRKPGQFYEPGLSLTHLMPFLKRATQGALNLAGKIAEVIAADRKYVPSKTHVLNGVYIPALHHLLSYEQPSEEVAEDEERRRKIKARYLRNAGDYLNAIKLGHPDGFWLPFAVRLEELFGIEPVHVTEPGHPTYRDGEVMIEWHLHFEREQREYAVILREGTFFSVEGLNTDEQKLEHFKQGVGAEGAVLVANQTPAARGIPADRVFEELIMDSDPVRAAESAYAALTGSASG